MDGERSRGLLGSLLEILQSWVKPSKRVVRPTGTVEVTGRTECGQRVTIRMGEGETRLVR